MAATLGESLAALIREGAGAGLVDLLYALAGQLAGNGPLENKAEVNQDEVDQPRVNKDKGAQGLRPLRLLHQSSLQDERLVAAFLGCRQVDGQWLTLGMGIDLTGNRCVIGLWKGSTSQALATQQMVSDLTSRALDTSRGLLVVTDGSKAIEQAILARFGQEVLLARCPLCWQQRVLARLPDTMHQEVKTTMQTVVGGEKGQDSLRRLIEKLRVKYPGAAAELEEGIELALVVPGLPLPTALKQQVQGIGCVRMAFQKAIRHTDGSLPPLKRMESGLGRIRTRRAVGYRDLPELAKILEVKKGAA